jgi:integrase
MSKRSSLDELFKGRHFLAEVIVVSVRWDLEYKLSSRDISHTCPVRVLQTWLATSGLVSGPLFRAVDRAGRIGAGRLTARIVGERLKKIGERSGLDPQSYAAHSLRSGFATSAARANKSEAAIMRQGRWKSIPVARRYIRAGSRWHDHAGAGIGL